MSTESMLEMVHVYIHPWHRGDNNFGRWTCVNNSRLLPSRRSANRALISRDEGQTWQDEVYYLDFTTFTGSYNASVVFDDDLILTVAGSSQAGNSWEAVKDHTDFLAIRWRPVED